MNIERKPLLIEKPSVKSFLDVRMEHILPSDEALLEKFSRSIERIPFKVFSLGEGHFLVDDAGATETDLAKAGFSNHFLGFVCDVATRAAAQYVRFSYRVSYYDDLPYFPR